MTYTYQPTSHAKQRCAERAVTDADIHTALGRGKIRIFERGMALYRDRGVTVVVNVPTRRIVTVWRS